MSIGSSDAPGAFARDAPASSDRQGAVQLDKLCEQLIAAYRDDDEARVGELVEQILSQDPDQGLAWTYRGLVALNASDWVGARQALERAVKSDPTSALAWFNLGSADEALGDLLGATSAYGRSAGLAPEAQAPRVAFARVVKLRVEQEASGGQAVEPALPRVSAEPGVPRDDADQGEAAKRYGLYEVLLKAPDELARQPLPLMDRLATEAVSPRLSAYLYRIAGCVAGALLLSYAVVQFRSSAQYAAGLTTAPGAPLASVLGVAAVLAVLSVAYTVLLALTTRYTIRHGRVQVVKGVVVRKTVNLELYRVTNITVTRNLFQRWTADGTLVLDAPGRRVRLIGLVAGPDALHQVWRELLDLVFALRSSAYVRGIIT